VGDATYNYDKVPGDNKEYITYVKDRTQCVVDNDCAALSLDRCRYEFKEGYIESVELYYCLDYMVVNTAYKNRTICNITKNTMIHSEDDLNISAGCSRYHYCGTIPMPWRVLKVKCMNNTCIAIEKPEITKEQAVEIANSTEKCRSF